jgi:hypothetical protein
MTTPAFTKAALNLSIVGIEVAAAAWLFQGVDFIPWGVVTLAGIAGSVAGVLERFSVGLGRPWLLVPETSRELPALLTASWQGRASLILRWATYASCMAVGVLQFRSWAAGFAGIFLFEAVREISGLPPVCWRFTDSED